MKINTIFSPGSYGTFISWCIYSFSQLNESNDIIIPNDLFGSAHKFRESNGFNIVRPSHYLLDGLITNYILVECDENKIINYIDNQFQKDFFENLKEYMKVFFSNSDEKLKNAWHGTDRWQLRELLSFFLEDMIKNTKLIIDDSHQQIKNNNSYMSYTVNPEVFLLNAANELEKILLFFNLNKHKKFKILEFYVLKFVESQKNFAKHQQINEFVKNTINGHPYSIPNLTIFDEAYIQHTLRKQGYNLKCYNLNKFLNSSIKLSELLT
jgi:hypothetical protein